MEDNAIHNAAAEPVPSRPRVLLLGDDRALRVYGPVLRRMCVGLLDEVDELSLFCLGDSRYLDFVPCPPVRIIREMRHYYETMPRTEKQERRVEISSSGLLTLETLMPHRRDARLAEILAEFKPTVIHVLQDHLLGQGRALARLLDLPLLVSILTSNTNVRPHDEDLAAGAALVSCSQTFRALRKRYAQQSRRIQFVPIGAHSADFTSSFMIEGRIPQIIVRRQFQHGMGLDLLIDALRLVADEYPDIAVALSGEGRLEHHLRHKVTQLKLSETVHFIDPIMELVEDSDALKTFLGAYDIFVVPQLSEEWQPSLLEAMSVGNTIIAPEGMAPDLLRADETAILFEPGQTRSLAQAIKRAIRDRAGSRQLGINVQNHLKRHFRVSSMVRRLSEVYAWATRRFSGTHPDHTDEKSR